MNPKPAENDLTRLITASVIFSKRVLNPVALIPFKYFWKISLVSAPAVNSLSLDNK